MMSLRIQIKQKRKRKNHLNNNSPPSQVGGEGMCGEREREREECTEKL
jgi:hypothetical protein